MSNQIDHCLGGGRRRITTDHQVGVSKNRVPQNGWFIMGKPIKRDDLGIPLFSETSKYHQCPGGLLF